jgi:hypothetical protein
MISYYLHHSIHNRTLGHTYPLCSLPPRYYSPTLLPCNILSSWNLSCIITILCPTCTLPLSALIRCQKRIVSPCNFTATPLYHYCKTTVTLLGARVGSSARVASHGVASERRNYTCVAGNVNLRFCLLCVAFFRLHANDLFSSTTSRCCCKRWTSQ